MLCKISRYIFQQQEVPERLHFRPPFQATRLKLYLSQLSTCVMHIVSKATLTGVLSDLWPVPNLLQNRQNMATEKPSQNGTETGDESENKQIFPWGIIGPIVTGITWLIVVACWIYLYCRNKKQRRERAERRARNLENQREEGQTNPAFATEYSVRY